LLSANAGKYLVFEVGRRIGTRRRRSLQGTIDLFKLAEIFLATGAGSQVVSDLSCLRKLKPAQGEGCQVRMDLRALHLMAAREVS
jgi:hypothetical protein